MTRIILLGVLATAACASADHPHAREGHGVGEGHRAHTKHHSFEDAERWSRTFDDPARDAWQKPDVVMAALGLSAADVVADIGAGTGYFTVRVARAAGKVLAVDVEPKMVEFIAQRTAKEGLGNIVAVLGAADDPKLPEKPSAVLLVDTAHHIEDRPAFFAKVRAQSQPGARLVVVEFHADRELQVGPPRAMRISHEQLAADLRAAGWQAVAVDVDSLPNQYIATYRAP